MADLGELLVRLDATTEGLRRELKRGDQAVADSARNVEASSARISRSLQQSNTAVASGFRSTGIIVQQAGFQIGDFAVQIASGQSPMRAFIQQGAQLLGFFGVWGAVAGAAVAVGGALVTTLLDLKSATDKYADAQKTLGDATKETNDLLQTQEDRAKAATNEKQLKAIDDLTKAAAQQASLLADAEKQLREAEKSKAEILERGTESGFGQELKDLDEKIAKLKAAIDGARGSMQQADQQAGKLFGNIVPADELEKLTDMRDELQRSFNAIGKDNAATLDAKLAADAAKKGITEETAAIRGRIVALQAEIDVRKQALEFADDEAKQRQSDSEDEVENSVKRVQAQGKLAFGANEEIRNNKKLNDALGVSQRAYDEQAETIKQIAAYRAAGLNSDEDVAAAEREAKALVASRYALQGHKDALKEIDDFGERVFDDIGQAATQMSLEGENAFGSLLNVGKAVANELTLEFIKLAAINPLKNALFGKDSPTLSSVGGIVGDIFKGLTGGNTGSALSGEGGAPGISFGGPRAGGGPVTAGVAYLTSERGPELFVPNTSGMIVSNDNLGRMGGGPTFNIDARGASVESVERLERMVRALNGSIEGRVIATVSDASRRGVLR